MIQTIALALFLVMAASLSAYEHGPDKGTLVIVGGNMQDQAIVKRFIDLAGGPGAPIVIIPTAGEDDDYDNYWSGLKLWRENGATNLTVIHTRDRSWRLRGRARPDGYLHPDGNLLPDEQLFPTRLRADATARQALHFPSGSL